jgi:Fic family protein
MSVSLSTQSTDGLGPTGWPIAGTKPAFWEPQERGLGPGSRAGAGGTFHLTVPAAIANFHWKLDSNLVAFSEAAALSASKFDARLESSIWSYDIVLLRSEAAASSQIENLSASPRAILEAELGNRSRANANLIAANTKALISALGSAGPITVETLLAVHATLMEGQTYLQPGALRTDEVWIGGPSPVNAKFVGPHASELRGHLEDLVSYCNRTDVPILIQVAVAHAQFETIHPFEDGNGRVGRVLMHLMLRNTDVTAQAVLPISGTLLKRSRDYYDALDAYRTGRPEPIISMVAHSVMDAVFNGHLLMQEVGQVENEWMQRVSLRADSGAWQLLKFALRQPVFTADSAIHELGMAKVNFYRNVAVLTDAGLLVRSTFGKGQDSWRAPMILEAMQNFADRAGFRSPA